jgi:hypothetical protein
MNEELSKIMQEIDRTFTLIHEKLDSKELNLDDDYKKINYTYFSMFCSHYESFLILIQNHHFSSAILLLRTMLELYVKSFYLEHIEKEKNTNVLDFLEDKIQFPTFFNMVKALENHIDKSGAKFDGAFKQFTKSELASYEKFSLFSHGKGEYLKASFIHNKLSYTEQQLLDVIQTAKGLFETLSLLLFYVQGFHDELKDIISELQK